MINMESSEESLEQKSEESNLTISSSLLESLEDEADDSISDFENVVSPELARMLSAVPKEDRRSVQKLLLMNLSSSALNQTSPIVEKIESSHIEQILINQDNESQRGLDRARATENTRRFGIFGILALVLMVLVFAGLSGDRVLSEKILIAGVSGLGGFGAGVAVSKHP
jgi:hypothetical protein